ncbi:MAG: YdbL family protein [Deltaproteobacteria bacterium]|nr:YdbL family protein [Deltaproteobacteria bacterium]
MKKAYRVLLLAVVAVLLPLSVFALSLDEAKAKGLVGEEPSGYLGVVVASPDATQVVQEINAKRRQKYQQIAAQNGTAVAAVEALAGQKAIESTPAGQYVKAANGSWVKK